MPIKKHMSYVNFFEHNLSQYPPQDLINLNTAGECWCQLKVLGIRTKKLISIDYRSEIQEALEFMIIVR